MKSKFHRAGIALAAVITLCFAFAPQVASGDTITNAVTAITGTAGDDLINSLSPTNATAATTITTNVHDKVLTSATGIAGLGGDDQIASTAALTADASTELGIPLKYSSAEGAAASIGIAGGAGRDVITNGSSIVATSRADTTIGEFFLQIDVGVTGWPTISQADSRGIDGGSDEDAIANSGPVTVAAHASSQVNKGRVGMLNAPVDLLGPNDARTTAESAAIGITAGQDDPLSPLTGVETIYNRNSLSVTSSATAKTIEMIAELAGAARLDAATTASNYAAGIVGSARDNVIDNSGRIEVDAVSSADLISGELKISGLGFETVTELLGFDVGKINTKAETVVTGIGGGSGSDTVIHSGPGAMLDVEGYAQASSLVVNLEINPGISPFAAAGGTGLLAAGSSGNSSRDSTNTADATGFANAGTAARTTVTGIAGDDGNDTLISAAELSARAESHAASTNIGIGVDLDFGGGSEKIAAAETTVSAQSGANPEDTAYVKRDTLALASASGIAGGNGDDTMTSAAPLTAEARSYATATSIKAELSLSKDSYFPFPGMAVVDSSTGARSTAIGIDAGSGNDTVSNAAALNASAHAEANSLSVGTVIAGTLEGLVAGVAVTDVSSEASAASTGISGGQGGDSITNSGAISSSATAKGNSTGVSVTLAGAKVGMAFGVAVADATTSARADAWGIDLGQQISTNGFPGDTIMNTGSVSAAAASTNSALAVGVTVSAALEGVVGGVTAVNSDATSDATATAIRTGSGDDLILSEGAGSLTANSAAKGSSDSIAVTVSGAWKGAALGAALADATTAATAVSKGIDTGDGRDTILNGTAITNSATADANSLSVATTFAGAWMGAAFGVSLADGTTKATASATGIDSGAAGDTITNSAVIATSATADAESKSIAVTVAIAPKGISAGLALARTGTESLATAGGIGSGEGDDVVANAAVIDVDATAKTKTKVIAINVAEIGAAMVDASSTATANAAGVNGGSGIDWLWNDGRVDVTANSTIDATSAAANFVGYASGNVGMTNIAVAAGIQSANLTDSQTSGETIYNGTNGSVNVLAHATTDSKGYVVQGGGAEFAKVGAVADATATGLAGSQGADTILNEGTNSVTAWTEVDAISSSYQLVGVQLGSAGINATGVATGIEGGAGTNLIVNGTTGFIAADTRVDTLAGVLSAGFGVSFALSGVTADAVSRGIHTGADADAIENLGRIEVTASSLGQAAAGSIGLFGFNLVSSLAQATVEGINAGAGNDWIFNSGVITAGRVRPGETNLAKADSEAVTFDLFSYSLASLGARAQVAGIAGAGGDDTVLNTGAIAVGDTNHWLAWGEAFAFGGQIFGSADAYGGSSATVTASGVDGGDGVDTMVNTSAGVITVDARSGAYGDSMTYESVGFLLPSTAESKATATVTATGIQGGTGADAVSNAGLVDSRAYAFAKADSDSDISFDIATTAIAKSHANANATAAGIDLGAGRNYAENTGSINALATAKAKTYARTDATFDSAEADVYSRPVATATGILAGNDGNTVLNLTNGSITASAVANTTDAQGNVSYANSDSGRDALAVAGAKQGGGYLPIAANATGIGTGNGADAVLNDGSITVNARSDGLVKANSDVWYRYPRSDALAFVAATAKGIAAGKGQNSVVNNGSLDVTAWGHGVPKSYSWSRDYRATANSFASVNAYATGIEADGAVSNSATGHINVTARATAYAEADTAAENTYAKASLYADATGFSPATGSSGTNYFFNDGNVHVLASAGEDAAGNRLRIGYAHSSVWVRSVRAEAWGTSVVHAVGMRLDDRPGYFFNNGVLSVEGRARGDVYANGHSRDYHPAGISYMTTDASAYGIQAGSGDNVLVNRGTISVKAYADSFAKAYADENVGAFRDEEARGTAYANARAYGIQTGNGNNVITNEGTIAVTTISTAAVSVDTEDNDDEYRTTRATASVVGIQTGSGNDTIINRGTIATTNQIGSRIGIDAGAGNDTVALLDNSYVRGDILLGTGDDTLELAGTPTVASMINAGAGTDTLTMVGAGSLAGSVNLVGFEQAVKTGAGTFSLPQLATVQWLKIEEGTLQLNSSYQFGSNSLFESWLNRDGSCGLFYTPASIELAGALDVHRRAGPFAIGSTLYDVIVATNGLTGMFTDTNLPSSRPLLSFGVNYLPDRLQVEAVALSFTTFASNKVAWAVGDYLDRILPGSSGDLAYVLDTFQQLSEPEFPVAFSSLSPDSYDNYSRATHNLVRQYSRSVQQRLDTLRLNAALTTGQPRDAMVPGQNPVLLASAGSTDDIGGLVAREQQREATKPNGVWASGFGQWSDQEAEDGYTGFSFSPWGIAIGYDRAFSDAFTLGVSAAYASTHVSLDENRGSGDIGSYSGAAYGSYFKNNFHFESVLSYGYNDYKNQRNLVVDSIFRRTESTHDGQAFGGFLSGGYIWQLTRWALEPFASLQYTHLDESSFQESGADSVSLWVQDRQTQSLVSELGVRLAYVLKRERFTFIPELSLAWNCDFGIDDRVITASFAGSPNTTFSIPGQKVTPHGLTTGAAVTFLFGKGISTSVRYNGELRDDYSAHAVLGELRFTF